MRKVLFTCLCLLTLTCFGQIEFKFRVWLKDKDAVANSNIDAKSALTTRSILRREKQHILLDSTDIPVSKRYIGLLAQTGVRIVTTSRWMNTVVVAMTDSSIVNTIRQKSFVKATELVWVGQGAQSASKFLNQPLVADAQPRSATEFAEYGSGLAQLSVSNAQKLHQAGFRGEGKVIALIDAGFMNTDTISAYKRTTILGTKDFVNPGGNVFKEDKHGEQVLSTVGAIDSFHFIGSAPRAAFWLLRTEDAPTEFPVEEDYWAAAAEFADSVGVDVINSSLGYAVFDLPALDHTHEQLDGKTIFVTRAAQMAADKGIFVCISAGNEGSNAWKNINAPADAADVLTVGAINIQHQIASFSSLGYTADNRVKPDVVAVGQNTYLLNMYGQVSTGSGTSFSSPLMAGMATCLWQALPQLTNKELLTLIRQQSNFYTTPDVRYGYGIPDLWNAYLVKTDVPKVIVDEPDIFFSNKRSSNITVRNLPTNDSVYTLNIYTQTGKMIHSQVISNQEQVLSVKALKQGFYVVYIEGKNHRFTKKLIK
ncbi:MAG: S8 family peptidase [Bacteroidales bacterium]